MIRYGYNTQFTPAAPLVHVALRSPDGTRQVAGLPAQLDTASDRTVVPLDVVQQLGLVQMDQITVVGIGGSTLSIPTFLVQVEIRQLQPLLVEVAASSGEPMVLLGRDVLNLFKIVLDGPQLKLEMG